MPAARHGHRHVRSHAKANAEAFPQPASYKLWPTEYTISKELYNFVEFGVVVATLAVVDAGFSGDWSRIGVLTTDQELVLQELVKFIVVAHGVTAALTVRVAQENSYSIPEAVLKGFAFGSLGLVEIHQRCELAKSKASSS